MNNKSNLRIIVIDDNEAIHRDFIKILTTQLNESVDELERQLFDNAAKADEFMLPQFQIDTASQGQEGVLRIQNALDQGLPYALAFVDIRMPPGWDGIETIKHIWEIDKDIQVVICTAFSDYTWEETISALGMSDNLLILKKPFDSIAVRQLACALTKKWQLLQETRQFTATLKKQVEDRTKLLEYQVKHDALTGLPNRVLLHERILKSLDESAKNKKSFAMLFLDFDRFKLINDSLSHAVGDDLLQAASQRLQGCIRSEDTLARLGGDEFVIILSNIDDESYISERAKQLINMFQEPFKISDRHVTMTVSIGISVFPKNGMTGDILLRNADTAMYCAKERKGNNFQFYTDEMNTKSLAKLDFEMQLRDALVNNEFFLCYQPQMNLKSGKIVSVEALIRWQHPEKGVILPLDFIPLAEETGLIVPMGEWVMRKACAQNKAWQDAGLAPIRVAVNVTAQQFARQNLPDLVQEVLKATNLSPEYLEIELTENVIVSNSAIISAVVKLKELGVTIAIDDFGTGYSSLSYLKKIPLDRLKIDSSFIQHIQSASDDEVIIRAVISMAKSLDLEVLAEGVETQDQLNFLKTHECGDVQGFYFSKPLTISELEKFLKDPSNTKIALSESDSTEII